MAHLQITKNKKKKFNWIGPTHFLWIWFFFHFYSQFTSMMAGGFILFPFLTCRLIFIHRLFVADAAAAGCYFSVYLFKCVVIDSVVSSLWIELNLVMKNRWNRSLSTMQLDAIVLFSVMVAHSSQRDCSCLAYFAIPNRIAHCKCHRPKWHLWTIRAPIAHSLWFEAMHIEPVLMRAKRKRSLGKISRMQFRFSIQ